VLQDCTYIPAKRQQSARCLLWGGQWSAVTLVPNTETGYVVRSINTNQ
jgi:hypothetical protein